VQSHGNERYLLNERWGGILDERHRPNFDDQVTDMAKRARKDDEEDRPRRYRTALE